MTRIKFKATTKIAEMNILKICVLLMCISGMLQSSLIFEKWTIIIRGCKYTVLLGSILIVLMNQNKKKNFRYFLETVLISALILTTCFLTKDFSYMLVCMVLVLSRRLKIEDFVKISYKTLIVFGGGTFSYG